MILHVDADVQISRRSAVLPRLALARQADAIAVVDAGRHLHLMGLAVAHPPLAAAGHAGVTDDPAGAAALRAGLLDGEEALAHADVAVAAAGIAGHRRAARLGAAALARRAFLGGRSLDLYGGAEDRLLQRELEIVLQVRAAVGARTASAGAGGAEDVAEHGIEDVAEAGRAAETRAGGRGRVHARVAELIVGGALALVAQDLEGLLDLLEFLLRGLVARIPIRVQLHRQPAICLLDLGLGRVPADLEQFVVIAFRHGSSTLSAQRAARGPATGQACVIRAHKARAGIVRLHGLTFPGEALAPPSHSAPRAKRARRSRCYLSSFTSSKSASTTVPSSAFAPEEAWAPAPPAAPACCSFACA